MLDARWNPERKVRWDQPHALTGRHLHEAANRIDQLIRSVGVFGYLKTTRVFVRQGSNGNSGPRIVFL